METATGDLLQHTQGAFLTAIENDSAFNTEYPRMVRRVNDLGGRIMTVFSIAALEISPFSPSKLSRN
jgi:hypothetical protein